MPVTPASVAHALRLGVPPQIRKWQDEVRPTIRSRPRIRSTGLLVQDVPRYLATVKGEMTSYKDRQRHLEAWLPEFGDIRTQTLMRRIGALNTQLGLWRQTLSASTCNHRRDAITGLVRVLYGKRHWRELADDLVKFKRGESPSRAIPLAQIDAALVHLNQDELTYPRLLMMRWTGMRPSQMAKLTPESFHLEEDPPHVVVPRGKGERLVRVPLVGPNLDNARVFLTRTTHRGNCFGSWSCPSANKRLGEACEKAAVPRFTVYQIRHSVAQTLRERNTDVADVQELLGHTSSTTTKIYARPVNRNLAKALKKLA